MAFKSKAPEMEDEVEPIVDVDDYVVSMDDIDAIDPLPKQSYIGEVLSHTYFVSEKGDPKINIEYKIDTTEYPADYDAENAPEGTKLFSPYGGTVVDCGQGPQPSRRGLARVKKLMQSHGYTGKLRFTRRDDLTGAWGLADECLAELVGSNVKLTLGHDSWQGELRATIKSIDPVD